MSARKCLQTCRGGPRGLLASGDIPGLLWHLRAHGEALPLGEVARLVAGAARFAGFDDLAQAGVLAVDAVDGEHRVRLRCELAPALFSAVCSFSTTGPCDPWASVGGSACPPPSAPQVAGPTTPSAAR